VDGADETYRAAADLRSRKRMETITSGMLASAGYYITAPSHKIYASNPTDAIGSIGIITAAWDFSGAFESMGIKRVEIRSKNAPNKAANPATKAGRDVIQERLDAMERIFYQRISESRGITGEEIAERFGQGALLVAKDPSPDATDAIRAGMIDGLVDGAGFGRTRSHAHSEEENNAEPLAQANNPASAGNQQEVPYMNLSEFLAQGATAAAELAAHDKLVSAEAIKPYEARASKAAVILGSESYAANPIVRKKAVECLEGKISTDALDGVVGMADMLAEQKKTDAAAEEQGDQEETPGQAPKGEASEIQAMGHLIATAGKPKEGK
jgi:ClpP class serine protease